MAPSGIHKAYAEGERVLCFQDGLLCEAKIIGFKLSDSTDEESVVEYLVHYKRASKM